MNWFHSFYLFFYRVDCLCKWWCTLLSQSYEPTPFNCLESPFELNPYLKKGSCIRRLKLHGQALFCPFEMQNGRKVGKQEQNDIKREKSISPLLNWIKFLINTVKLVYHESAFITNINILNFSSPIMYINFTF